MPTLQALLLTDVVDSTRLTEELGDAAMAALWTTHDRIARDLVPLWRGREIDKTDGMLLLFDDVRDAVGYALDYHRALAARELPFKARAGIHVGPVGLRPNLPDDVARGAKPVEVDGLALPIAARVMSVAMGAQTLLSADARLALGVATQRVMSHGHWRLHGVADPVELFEVGEPGEAGRATRAPFKPPPDGAKVYRVMRQGDLWQPLREVRHSVPAERDSFVGRQEPLAVLAKKFDDGARCVSVVGMGGTGKTRFVTRFAWTVLGDYPGGVWFCDLSQARTVDGIHFAVAQGLDVPLGKTEPVVQLARAIAGRGQCLLILDNFEQVARFAEETLGRWLERAPLAHFIITTREVLGIVGEETFALTPLPSGDAAALFLRRAESAIAGYTPLETDVIAIGHLVSVLDGLPLAIELAAARVRVMSPSTLLARMSDRFSVLLSRAGRHDRQATLRAAFDWSWELLTEAERAALAQLSVFEGGFTLESAAATLTFAGILEAPPQVADVVQGLADKSFVRQLPHCRFDLLESVRDYAGEHLRTTGRFTGSGPAAADHARQRHWLHFASLENYGAGASVSETNNLVSACRSAIAAQAVPAAIGTLIGAWAVLRLRGPLRVGFDLANAARDLRDLTPRDCGWIEWVAGSAAEQLGSVVEARGSFEAGLAAAIASKDRVCELQLLASTGALDVSEGKLSSAVRTLEIARALAVSLQDAALHCSVLITLGHLADAQGELQPARGHYEAALALARRSGNRRLEGGLLGNLGGLHHDAGRLDEAFQNYSSALKMAQEVGDRRWEGSARCNLGLVHHQQGRQALALSELRAALDIGRDIGNPRLECVCTGNLGMALETAGDIEQARAHYETAVSGAREIGDARSEGQFCGYLGLAAAKLGRHDEAHRALAKGEQLLRRVSDRLSLALLLCQRAESEALMDCRDDSGKAFHEAARLAVEMRAEQGSELMLKLVALRGLLQLTSE